MINLGRNALIYICILFGLSVAGWVLCLIFPGYGIFFLVYMSWVPSIGAVISIFATCKHRNAIARLFVRLIKVKAPLQSYTLVLVYILILLAVFTIVFIEGSIIIPSLNIFFSFWISILPLIVVTSVLGEEAGIRGYLLDELQRNNSFPLSSLVGALVWAATQLVIWFIPESGLGYIPLPALLLLVAGTAVSLNTLANVSAGSLFPVLLSRVFISSSLLVFPLLGSGAVAAVWIFAAINAVYAGVILYRGWTRPIPPNTVS